MNLDAAFRPCDYHGSRPVQLLQLLSIDYKFRSAVYSTALTVRDTHPPVFLRENSRAFRAPAAGSPTILCQFRHGENSGRIEDSTGFGNHHHSHGKTGGNAAGNGIGGSAAAGGSSSSACGGTGDRLGDNIYSKGEKKRMFGSERRGPNLDFHFDFNRSSGTPHDCSCDYSSAFKDSRPAWACSSSWSILEGSPCPLSNLHVSTEEYVSKNKFGQFYNDRLAGRSNFHKSFDDQMSESKIVQPSFDESPTAPMSGIEQSLLKNKFGTAGMPMSLRMLKSRSRRQSQGQYALSSHRLLAISNSTCCAFKKAFSSMLFIIRSVQNHTIQLRQSILYEDLQGVLAAIQREMHWSFLWLFQQVFSCTPKLMLSVMLLLANYTVYSMSNYVAFDSTLLVSASTDLGVVETMSDFHGKQASETTFAASCAEQHEAPVPFTEVTRLDKNSDTWTYLQAENGAGGSSKSVVSVSGGSEGPQYSKSPSFAASVFFNQDINAADLQKLGKDLHNKQLVPEGLDKGSKNSASMPLMLDWDVMRALIVPVISKLAPDDYSCYDRTDLVYQHAICNDINNAMLLANYAQLLFLVRHDHDRAEQLFTRAVSADPGDGDIIGRYASFLWLARRDRMAADKAYRRAIDIDPANPYFAAMYAHFLWHNAAGEDSIEPPPPSSGLSHSCI